MTLKDLLSEKRSAILKRWLDDAIAIYPSETSGLLKDPKRQFTNPIGYTLSQELDKIFDGLLDGIDLDRLSPALDSIIRIRAVQDVNPSQALTFLLHLKKIIREELGNGQSTVAGELLEIESKIDALALISFDIYMKCREKIYDLKAKEVRNMTFRLLQRANLVCEVEGQ